jgi:hypothetical protein
MDSLNTDQKQYRLMSEFLNDFKQGNLQLSSLIDILDALLEALQDFDERWKENFRSEWWTLEQVYAVARDRNSNSVLEENKNLIDESIENMGALLKKYLDQ